MMPDEQYNEFFRSRLDDFSSPVADHIWDAIEVSNRKPSQKKRLPAKYILLLFCLMAGMKTSDKLMNSASRSGDASLYRIDDKRTAIGSVIKGSMADDKKIADSELINQTTKAYHVNAKKKTINKLPGINGKMNSKEKDKTITSIETGESHETTDSDFDKTADSAAANIAAIKKKPVMQNHSDSTDDIAVETQQNKDRLSLYVFASPDAVFSHVSAGNKSYEQQRNREAKSRFSWSAGVRVRYNINAHWSGNIGFQYSMINEKITLATKTSDNRYTSFDVPLIAGYRIYKNRFEADANAGIVFNVSAAYKGYISSSGNEAVNVQKENVYQSNTSLSYYAGIQFLYRPANRISLFAEPYFRYQPQNIANAFQPFEERVQKAGIMLGARYRFNK